MKHLASWQVGLHEMVSLSTFCCGSHCLCFCAELQAVVECPITRFIGPWSHSCYPYIFEFRTRDVGLDCRYNVEGGGGGGHNLCTDGEGMGRSRWAGTLSYAKITQSLGSIYFSSPVPGSHRKTDTAFITPAAPEKNIDGRYMHCHGHSQVSHLASRPFS